MNVYDAAEYGYKNGYQQALIDVYELVKQGKQLKEAINILMDKHSIETNSKEIKQQ